MTQSILLETVISEQVIIGVKILEMSSSGYEDGVRTQVLQIHGKRSPRF
jgi:hypothetical protein